MQTERRRHIKATQDFNLRAHRRKTADYSGLRRLAVRGETLAEYYMRTHDHLVPDEVEIWEYDEDAGKATVWGKAVRENPLKKALEAASQLPEEEQDAVAEWLLAELASEAGWVERFAGTQDTLLVLAQEALRERRHG